MKIKRVGIDIDGVVADYLAVAIPMVAEHYGLTPDLSNTTYILESVFGLTEDTFPKDFKKVLYEDNHLFAKLPLLETNIQLLNRRIFMHKSFQHDYNTKVYFITSRPRTPIIMEDTLTWIQKHEFHFDDVFFVKDKAGLCRALRIDVIIEDEPRNIEALSKTDTKVVIRDQPWNKEIEETDNLKRVFNWQQALETTKEFLL